MRTTTAEPVTQVAVTRPDTITQVSQSVFNFVESAADFVFVPYLCL